VRKLRGSARYSEPRVASIFISLLVEIACAYACSTIAARKGRGTTLWAILGFIFGLVALIVIAILPRKREY